MESEVEHWEVPMEEAAVKSSGTMKKRHRGRQLVAGQLREPKELTPRECGSRKKLAAACRKVSLHAAVAWHKRKVFRKIWTQGSCGSLKQLTAVKMMMTHRGKVAWLKGNVIRKNRTRDNVVRGTLKGWKLRQRECGHATKAERE
jgi:hypothetical protein